jgi:hypothetical protein
MDMSDEQIPLTSDAPTPPQQQAGQGQAVRLGVDTKDMKTHYANFFRVTGTFEEIMLDFGLHSGLMTQTGPEAVQVNERLVLSFPTAKRLLAALQMSIQRHEQLFGAIETDPQRRVKQQPK